MTTIAWDGEVLASDTLVTYAGEIKRHSKKLFKLDENTLVGLSGNITDCLRLYNWLSVDKGEVSKYPDFSKEDSAYALVIKREFEDFFDSRFPREYSSHPVFVIKEYSHFGPYPITFRDKKHAIGSGMAFALAAMECGKTAIEAVEIAGKFDVGTSSDDTHFLTFDVFNQPRTKKKGKK
jgi:hypothetical protein